MKKTYTLLIIFFIIFLNTSIVWAKNNSTISGNINLEIAKPVIEMEHLKTDTNSKETTNYYFKIKNYNENNEISQITQKYTLKIITNNRETLESVDYNLYQTNEEGEEQHIIDIEDCYTEEIEICGETQAEQYYKLSIQNNNENIKIEDEIFIQINSSSVNL